MSLEKLNAALVEEVAQLGREGRAKAPERVIAGHIPARGDRWPRYRLAGCDGEYLRMNSNSYLSLSHHPALLAAADDACREFGAGPGAVRFIDGTSVLHARLEARIAQFVSRQSARIFNSAYTTVLGLAVTLTGPDTYWIGDELNHNCIIRAMRLAGVPREQRAIFRHNDFANLRQQLERVPAGTGRVVVIFDGIFSMRGDNAPLDEILAVTRAFDDRFRDGVVTVMDDSHGIAAYGPTGRGTEEHCGAAVDCLVGTFGKAFGVNGGFVAASTELIEAVRQKADTYIYISPLGASDCAAALAAVDLADGPEGRGRLDHLRERTSQFRRGLEVLGFESIPGPHPVVPLLVRDTDRVRAMVRALFDRGILVVGLTFPVVPKGQETIRFQVNAAHTRADIDKRAKCEESDGGTRLRRGTRADGARHAPPDWADLEFRLPLLVRGARGARAGRWTWCASGVPAGNTATGAAISTRRTFRRRAGSSTTSASSTPSRSTTASIACPTHTRSPAGASGRRRASSSR
jgi:glycine C-acetyltransferase